MVNEKSLANLKKGRKFSSDTQPDNPGRKPSVLNIIKTSGISITDIRQIIDGILWEYSPGEIAKLLKDKENPLPMGVTLILGALISDQKKTCLYNWEILMNRSHGKATQTIDIPPDTLARVTMTSEERRLRIEELLNKGESKSKIKSKKS